LRERELETRAIVTRLFSLSLRRRSDSPEERERGPLSPEEGTQALMPLERRREMNKGKDKIMVLRRLLVKRFPQSKVASRTRHSRMLEGKKLAHAVHLSKPISRLWVVFRRKKKKERQGKRAIEKSTREKFRSRAHEELSQKRHKE